MYSIHDKNAKIKVLLGSITLTDNKHKDCEKNYGTLMKNG